MRQHPDPDDLDHQDLDDGLGRPVYQGSGLSVRALTAEELQRFLDAHHGQPAQRLGSGWAALDPPGQPPGVSRTPPGLCLSPPGPSRRCRAGRSPAAWAAPAARPWPRIGGGAPSSWPAGPAAWPGGRRWSPPPASPPTCSPPRLGLPQAGLVGLAVAAMVGWRLRFRPSEQARTWQRGAHGERHTARLLGRLPATGTWSSTTWPCPARPPTWITW